MAVNPVNGLGLSGSLFGLIGAAFEWQILRKIACKAVYWKVMHTSLRDEKGPSAEQKSPCSVLFWRSIGRECSALPTGAQSLGRRHTGAHQ